MVPGVPLAVLKDAECVAGLGCGLGKLMSTSTSTSPLGASDFGPDPRQIVL